MWSLLYAIPHLYWGLGGRAGLSLFRPEASETGIFEAANVFASFLIAFAGCLGFVLERLAHTVWPRRIALFICGAGAAIAAAHGVYGIIFRIEQWTGVLDVDGERFSRSEHAWVLWDLFLIEPWFVVEGAILWLTGYCALVSTTERRRWGLGTAALFGVAFASAVAGVNA
ncbi:MAG: DUF3995 domain-containing protein [Dehalococcoidia bacterium]